MKGMIRRRRIGLLWFSLAVVLTLVACGGGGGGEAIKVGAIFDLTGPTSDVGTPYADGLKDYVAWKNAEGGVDGRDIELISADYAYAVDQAEQLYSQYTTQDEVVVFMGWGTGDTEALHGRIADDEIPFMSASYSAVLGNPAEAPYNFMIGTTYSDQFIIAIKWAQGDWAAAGNSGQPTIAFLHHNSPFGLSPWEDGLAYAESQGIEMFAVPMPSGATDLTAELTQVQDNGAHYIVIQNVSSPASLLAKNAVGLGVEAQIVCLNWCSDELFIRLAGDAAEGVVGASPFSFPASGVPGLEDMEKYLEEKGGSLEDKGIRYVQGWLTMQVMTEAIQRVVDDDNEVTGANIRAALESIKNYDTGGLSTNLTFTAADHAGSKSLRMVQVNGGVWTDITDYISAN
jgi:branched-chain amino acid transport system substrate-binding protein